MSTTSEMKRKMDRRNAEAALRKRKEEEAKRVAEEIAKEKREHRFQILLVLLTAAATLFIEHFMELLDFFKNLFHG